MWNVQVGPVIDVGPLSTVTYHSKVWPWPMLAHWKVAWPPDATPLSVPICVKLPLLYGRAKYVTSSGWLPGSVTVTSSVGEVPTPLAPLVGAFS